jgi:hypothetical protein
MKSLSQDIRDEAEHLCAKATGELEAAKTNSDKLREISFDLIVSLGSLIHVACKRLDLAAIQIEKAMDFATSKGGDE